MIFGKNKSLACFKPKPTAKYRVFCLPSSGAAATLFRDWPDLFPDAEVWAANYPGRGSMHGDPFAASMDQVLAPMLEQQDLFEDRPFIVYGHSFGALVGFELVYRLQARGCAATGLVVSARRAPHLPAPKNLAGLSDTDFLRELDAMGGIPDVLRQNKGMMDFYLPIIRADLALNDSFCSEPSHQLSCPVYLFSGSQDSISSESELAAWKQVTDARFEHTVIDGGHFFIQDKVAEFSTQLRSVFNLLVSDDDDFIAF